jgi:hypothetical protein
MQPAKAAPLFRASIALPDSEPKLIPEMLTTESGRKLWRRRRLPPRIFAHGSHASCPDFWADGGTARPNVRWLTIMYPGVCSISLSVPNPK